jgi:hypothetical protein
VIHAAWRSVPTPPSVVSGFSRTVRRVSANVITASTASPATKNAADAFVKKASNAHALAPHPQRGLVSART